MEDKENEIDNKNLKTYQMLYLQTITQSYRWFQEQSPYLWVAFQKTIYGLVKIEEYKLEIKKYEGQITQLDLEIKQSTRIVAGEEAVLGWAGKNSMLASILENSQKVGLSTVPIVTLFSIAGIDSILNPFVNQGQPWGVIFLLWSSVAFVLLTSSAIIKLTYRLSKEHWQQTFWRVRVRTWFVLGCFSFGLVEGLGGGSLAANIINKSRQILIDRGSELSLLNDSEQLKITAIISLFAYLNILFSVAKGREFRILQPNKIRRDRAAKALEYSIENRKELMRKITDIQTDLKRLEDEIKFNITLQEEEAEVRDLSNANTLGMSFIKKHPGAYDREIPEPVANSNGHTTRSNSDFQNI
jgi:hypothetical protein